MVDEVTLSAHIQEMVSGDDGLMAEYDTQTLVEADPNDPNDPNNPTETDTFELGSDGYLGGGGSGELTDIGQKIADFVVTDLIGTFGGVADEATLRDEIKGVFAFDGEFSKADSNQDGKLSADEITSAIDGVVSVEDISIVNQTEFEDGGAEKDIASVEAGAAGGDSDTIFDNVGELTTYFDGIGLSTEAAEEVATILFQDEALKADGSDGITAATILAFMNGSLSSGDQTEDKATFDTFKTAVEELLEGATVFETNESGSFTEEDMLNLAGVTGQTQDIDLDIDNLETLFVNMGETTADAAYLAEWAVNFVHATGENGAVTGPSGTATSVNSTDLFKHIASASDDGVTGFTAEDYSAFSDHAKAQKDDTEYVNEGAFDNAITNDTHDFASDDGLPESDLTNVLLDLGVSAQYAAETASFLTENVGTASTIGDGEISLAYLNTYFENGHTNAGYYDEGGFTAANLNKLVSGILDGTVPSLGGGNYSYENGFSLESFKASAKFLDADGTDDVVEEAEFGSIAESMGVGMPAADLDYDSGDVADILIALGIDPELAPDVATYLVDQVGMYGVIPSEQLVTILANISDYDGDAGDVPNDTAIRADDMTTLIENYNDNVEMTQIVPVEDTENVKAGDLETENSFVYVSASDVDNADDDPSTISVTELEMAGEGAGITEDILTVGDVETLLLAMGVDANKADKLALVLISQYGSDNEGDEGDEGDDGDNDGISYAEMLDALSGGEETLSIDALQAFIDENEAVNLVPTETELAALFDGESYFSDPVFTLTDNNIDDNAAAMGDVLAAAFDDPEQLDIQASVITGMIKQKYNDLDGAEFTLTTLYDVLDAYARGETSLNGEVSGDGSETEPYALETSLEDLTIAELESLGDGTTDINGQYITMNDTKYLVTEDPADSGNYIIADVDGNGEGRALISDDDAVADYDADNLTDNTLYKIGSDDNQVNLVQLGGTTYELDADGNIVGEAIISDDGSGNMVLEGSSESTGEGDGTIGDPFIFSGSADVAAIEALEGFADYESGDTFIIKTNAGLDNEALFEVTVNGNNLYLNRVDTDGEEDAAGTDYVFQRSDTTISELSSSESDEDLSGYENQIIDDFDGKRLYVDGDGTAYEIDESGEIGGAVTITAGVADASEDEDEGGAAGAGSVAGSGEEDDPFIIEKGWPENMELSDITDAQFDFETDPDAKMYISLGGDADRIFYIEKTDNDTDTYVIKDEDDKPRQILTGHSEGLGALNHSNAGQHGVDKDDTGASVYKDIEGEVYTLNENGKVTDINGIDGTASTGSNWGDDLDFLNSSNALADISSVIYSNDYPVRKSAANLVGLINNFDDINADTDVEAATKISVMSDMQKQTLAYALNYLSGGTLSTTQISEHIDANNDTSLSEMYDSFIFHENASNVTDAGVRYAVTGRADLGDDNGLPPISEPTTEQDEYNLSTGIDAFFNTYSDTDDMSIEIDGKLYQVIASGKGTGEYLLYSQDSSEYDNIRITQDPSTATT